MDETDDPVGDPALRAPRRADQRWRRHDLAVADERAAGAAEVAPLQAARVGAQRERCRIASSSEPPQVQRITPRADGRVRQSAILDRRCDRK
ncbi:MAG TPA: hypothetical protein VHW23_40920 [Kofleriaceae bacterium]|jgi:hypothetical protein|nr:hypothetical protein [Kofleriaceae bacterium]